jgi:DNA invertase Pin-like site-specific DNA recombinase
MKSFNLFLQYVIFDSSDTYGGTMNLNIAYIRVSTVEQNEARQVQAMKQYNIDKVYQEKVSAKNIDRPKLQEMLDFAREGDTIYVADFSRLARSTKDLLELVELLESKGVQLVSIKENIDTSTATGRLMLKMISAINDFERENMLERQREGIAIAKAAGNYKGRKEVSIPDFDKQYKRYMNREVSKSQLAKELGVSRPTLDKLIKEHQRVTS